MTVLEGEDIRYRGLRWCPDMTTFLALYAVVAYDNA